MPDRNVAVASQLVCEASWYVTHEPQCRHRQQPEQGVSEQLTVPPSRPGRGYDPGQMQRLLYDAVWGNQQAMARMRGFAIEYLADPEAVLVLDKAGQEKSGTATIGVKRQYVGCAGRIANAVNVVYASYAGRAGHAIVTVRPHLPQERSATRPA